ncbi:MAG: retroviral-like aspartic protease family protein [Candidatus Pacearchaeota archaeon]|nr:retroviral-like aspartic protease family protein [Candidatus Pacearchaeota archaeon]
MILSNGGTKYDFMVLLDSGADVSAIPKQIAELLGLDLSGKVEKTFGIGGEVPAVNGSIDVEIKKSHEQYSFRIPVKVILDDSDFPPLIGRAVFFDQFDITFRQCDKRVDLKHREHNPF